MRDIQRIRPFLENIIKKWKSIKPEKTFVGFIINLQRCHKSDLFYIEDGQQFFDIISEYVATENLTPEISYSLTMEDREFINKLANVWEGQVPDWRFMQLFNNLGQFDENFPDEMFIKVLYSFFNIAED